MSATSSGACRSSWTRSWWWTTTARTGPPRWRARSARAWWPRAPRLRRGLQEGLATRHRGRDHHARRRRHLPARGDLRGSSTCWSTGTGTSSRPAGFPSAIPRRWASPTGSATGSSPPPRRCSSSSRSATASRGCGSSAARASQDEADVRRHAVQRGDQARGAAAGPALRRGPHRLRSAGRRGRAPPVARRLREPVVPGAKRFGAV